MSNSKNIYHYPEAYGLKIVAEIDYAGNYAFDMRVVWKDESGALLMARDSGCSCPPPFLDFDSIEDLDVLDFDAIRNEVHKELSKRGAHITAQEAQDFLEKVRRSND